MELQQIRYFLAICEHGGFSRAAQDCGVTQPALTTAVKKLEQEVGGDLFHREGPENSAALALNTTARHRAIQVFLLRIYPELNK